MAPLNDSVRMRELKLQGDKWIIYNLRMRQIFLGIKIVRKSRD